MFGAILIFHVMIFEGRSIEEVIRVIWHLEAGECVKRLVFLQENTSELIIAPQPNEEDLYNHKPRNETSELNSLSEALTFDTLWILLRHYKRWGGAETGP